MSPKITVLMPVFNAEDYLRESIESVLTQTYQDFEFLIINDASSDNSLDIINSYKDSRIKILSNKSRKGLAKNLNDGMLLASGEYIVRMDADDVSFPKRLEKQLEFMEKHKKVGLCGTSVKVIGRNEIWRYPEKHEAIKVRLLFNNGFAHPSVIMRKALFVKNGLFYNINYNKAQDYELWTRCVDKFQCSNLKEPLVYYRLFKSDLKKYLSASYQEYPNMIRNKLLKRLGMKTSKRVVNIHQKLSLKTLPSGPREFSKVEDHVDRLIKLNNANKIYEKKFFSKEIKKQWLEYIIASSQKYSLLGIRKLFFFFTSFRLKKFRKGILYLWGVV